MLSKRTWVLFGSCLTLFACGLVTTALFGLFSGQLLNFNPLANFNPFAESTAASTPTSDDQANVATATASETSTSPITPTATMAMALISVSQTTNCRSGPRGDYSYITEINAGEEVEVLMTFPGANYVVVRNPNGSGNCWLWLEYADQTDFGSFGLPVATQPPTPTPTNTATSTATPSLTPTATPSLTPTP
jgi:hypothetical protein